MIFSRKIKLPTLQVDQSDCGVACLSSVIIYYNGYVSLEKLRELSGTTQQGTTLLGLYQAAKQCGLTVNGLEATTDYLKTLEKPCLLHVLMDGGLQHFIICYGFKKGMFLIGDPARGVVQYTEKDLEDIWKSHSMLELAPGQSFKTKEGIKKQKKKWFLLLINADIPILVVIAIMGLLVSFSGIIISIFSQQLIDKILPEANVHKLIMGLILVGFILILRGGVNYLRSYLLNIQNRDFNNRLIDHFYSSLLFLPKFFFINRKTGELVARMEDTSRIQTVLAFLFGELVRDFLLVLVSIGIIFYYSSWVGMIVLISMPVFFIIALFYHKKVVNHQREVMAANAKKTSNYINTLTGIDTIKAHNKEHDFSLNNKLIYGVFQDKIFHLGKVGISLQLVSDIVSVLLIIAVFSVSSFLVLSKQLQIGELTALISISGSMLPSIGSLAFANMRLQGAKVAFDRMYDFTSIEPEYIQEISCLDGEDSKGENLKPAFGLFFQNLRLENISFRFPGRKPLLKNVSLELNRGKITALVGESGGGKSSLLNLLQRFYEPENGTMILNQHPMEEISTPFWRQMIGVVPQEISIFNGILLENICLGSTMNELKQCAHFCIQYGFDKFFNSFPQGTATILGEEGVNLSGGQKQLVALARAIYKKPQVLLLDEPTSAMDRNTEKFVINLLETLKKEMAIFIITHRMTMAEFADAIYILANGVTSVKGTPDELMAHNNLDSSDASAVLQKVIKNVT